VGVDNGNLSGNGAAAVALHGLSHSNAKLVGGFDTIVVGNGSNTITALAGVSTIVAGDGNDHILIGGSYNTVVAGNGIDSVVGVNVDHTSILLGDGGCSVKLSGTGQDVVKTGNGNDVICLSGGGNVVDAGAAFTFNSIFGAPGADTFVLAPVGSGFDKIYNFNLFSGDQLDLRNVLSGTHWDGQLSDLSHFLKTEIVNGSTLLECGTSAGGGAIEIAELVGTHFTLSMLEQHHCLLI
jgi:Ca2+-binding RTX toxin-like protein